MNTIEDRLRDAFSADARTVTPDSLRPPPERVRPARTGLRARAAARARPLIPVAAAAAVAVIAVLAVMVPHMLAGRAPSAASGGGRHVSGKESGAARAVPAWAGPYPPYFVAVAGNGPYLTVHNSLTGSTVARIAPPRPGLYFSSVGTGDGKTFLAALWKKGTCGTWLYQFRLSTTGRLTAWKPYALPAVTGLLAPVTVSQDGRTAGFFDSACGGGTGQPRAAVGVISSATGHVRQWALSSRQFTDSVSLSADGGRLAYAIPLIKDIASEVQVLPAAAAPGSAAQRGQIAARAASFGAHTSIGAAAVSPDGRTVYFTTAATGTATARGWSWQLRAADVRSGESLPLRRFSGSMPYGITADPSGRYLLIQAEQGHALSHPQLMLLNLVTGQLRFLRAGWLPGNDAAGIAW